MNVLIDGGVGFVGSHLCDRLVSEGHNVTVLDDLSNGAMVNIEDHVEAGRVQFILADVSKPIKECGDFDAIYHLACWPRSRSFADPQRDVEVNLLGTLNVLKYARQCNARVIFSSNSGIYDSTIQPIKEGNPEKPTTPYDVDKLASEHMIKAYGEAYGIPYTIFRFATVYGPRQNVSSEWNPVVATFIKTLREDGTSYITGDGLQTRDFIYVSDIVDALVKGANLRSSAGPLLLGSGVETSINDVFRIVCRVLGKPLKYDVRSRPLGEIQRMSYDCTQARNTLDWMPKVGLEEGVRRIVEEV